MSMGAHLQAWMLDRRAFDSTKLRGETAYTILLVVNIASNFMEST